MDVHIFGEEVLVPSLVSQRLFLTFFDHEHPIFLGKRLSNFSLIYHIIFVDPKCIYILCSLLPRVVVEYISFEYEQVLHLRHSLSLQIHPSILYPLIFIHLPSR